MTVKYMTMEAIMDADDRERERKAERLTYDEVNRALNERTIAMLEAQLNYAEAKLTLQQENIRNLVAENKRLKKKLKVAVKAKS